jgi:RimJ/RimL family protein N-acetyltransferase
MMNIQPLTLTGQYVCLEPLNESHIPELIKAGSDRSIWPSIWPSNQYQPDVMDKYIRNNLEEHMAGKKICFAVKHLISNRIIGMTSYQFFRLAHYGLDIGGTWLIVEFHRTPVNTECKYLMLKHAFEVLHCIRVQITVDEDNIRSINAVKRIGAVHEGILRNNYVVEGKYFDLNVYSIIFEEWPQVKLKLEHILSR